MNRIAALLALSLPAFGFLNVRAEEIEAELKFVVQDESYSTALRKLDKMDTKGKTKELTICFFETSEPSLGDVILRARKIKNDPDDSTVKVRSVGSALNMGSVEKKLEEEQDWTSTAAPNLSRSCDWEKVPKDLFDDVMNGREKTKDLFKGSNQSDLIKERLPKLDWSALRRYGPFEAEKIKYKFDDDFPEITVEAWHLEKNGQRKEVLELSAKVKAETQSEVKQKASDFFKAVEHAGFGKSQSKSKTAIVLDFLKPGL